MKKLLVSTRKGLLIYQLQNQSWTLASNHFNGIPISLSFYDHRTNLLWAFLDHGHWGIKIQRSNDWGKNWVEIPAPVYPEGAEVNKGLKANLQLIWAVAPDGPEGEGFWLGTEPGGLFHTKDGEQFELNQALWNLDSRTTDWFGAGRDYPGIHSICVDPRDKDHILLGISVAGVFESKDGGESWKPKNKGLRADYLPDKDAEVGQDPHYLVACKNHPDVLWQQNHCGIFKTLNAGEEWTDVSEEGGPANFGFAIAVDDHDPNKAWVVPAVSDEIRVAVDHALCVSRTMDGGKTWEAIRNGLPQENCYDIVYRHGLDKSDEHLVFGTTTGNLYTSDDEGESWNALSQDLAMIYAVKIIKL